ncbi:hypothetical protein [Paenibacillus humicus]
MRQWKKAIGQPTVQAAVRFGGGEAAVRRSPHGRQHDEAGRRGS